jgi:hypothetical protein
MMQRIAVLVCGVLLFAAAGVSAQTGADLGGTIAYVDPVAKTITFTDGRMVQLESNSKIYVNGREVPFSELRPGVIVTTPVASTVMPGATAMSGTVSYVDPVAKTITFTDGRVVQFDPRSRIFINGREVTFGDVRPGVVVMLNPSAPSSTVVLPGPTQQTAVAIPSAAAPVDVSGTITSIDRRTGILTLHDGRMLRLSEQGQVWQLVSPDSLRPGAHVLLSKAYPVGFRTSAAAPAWSNDPNVTMGRIVNVDPGGSLVLLSDGTAVRLNSSTTMQVPGGQTVTIRDLKPGDEVVVHLRQPAGVASTQTFVPTGTVTSGSAVAPGWQGYRAIVDADQVVVIRYPEAR